VTLIPIGRDLWGRSMHPDLVPIAYGLLVAAGFQPRQTVEQIAERSTKYSRRRREPSNAGDVSIN